MGDNEKQFLINTPVRIINDCGPIMPNGCALIPKGTTGAFIKTVTTRDHDERYEVLLDDSNGWPCFVLFAAADLERRE